MGIHNLSRWDRVFQVSLAIGLYFGLSKDSVPPVLVGLGWVIPSRGEVQTGVFVYLGYRAASHQALRILPFFGAPPRIVGIRDLPFFFGESVNFILPPPRFSFLAEPFVCLSPTCLPTLTASFIGLLLRFLVSLVLNDSVHTAVSEGLGAGFRLGFRLRRWFRGSLTPREVSFKHLLACGG